MDSYEILNVSRDSSDKEIEISYEDLKKKYDPSFNTSIRAYKKYREILTAYEDIKNESRRKMYDLRDTASIKEDMEDEYKLFDYHSKKEDIEESVDYASLEEIKDVEKEDIVVRKSISYLYFLLNLKVDVSYSKMVNCGECSSYVDCPLCDGVGVVFYREKQVYCPKCHGVGKVSSNCHKCNGEGQYKKEENISFYVDNDIAELKGYGNEYYDGSVSNLKIVFDFYEKDNIVVKDNEIKINYYLSKEETLKGVKKEYYGENGVFKLEVASFVENGYREEILFNDKRIVFVFYNEAIDGNNKVNYLFINNNYMNSCVYFNDDYSECRLEESEKFVNRFSLKDETFLKGFGEKGKYGGKDGDLIIKCKFTKKNELEYIKDLEIIETSKLFNMLGGKFNNISHFGLKRDNYLLNKNGRYYLLSGNSSVKRRLKDYYLFRLICLLFWFIIPCLIFFIPYSQTMFIVLLAILSVYLVLVNLLMEVRV